MESVSWRIRLAAGLCCVLLALVSGVVVAADTDGDVVADAGLDQEVEQNATVLLDATRSRSDSAPIDRYNWTVEPPFGPEVDPCGDSDCARSSFRAEHPGTYEVTLTVHDTQGNVANDSMYVHVIEPEWEELPDSPAVAVSGPPTTTVNESTTVSASAAPGNDSFDRIEWYKDGVQIANRSLEAHARGDELTVTPDEIGITSIRADVVDTAGERATDTHTIAVMSDDSDGELDDGGGSFDRDIRISGPTEFLAGDEPVGTYEMDGILMPRIEHHWTEWTDSSGRLLGSGESVTIEWEPGVHKLYALAHISDMEERDTIGTDGWTEAANVHTVTVDPAPSIEVTELDGGDGSVSGHAVASEPATYLTDVSVSVNGETITTKTPDNRNRQLAAHLSDGRADDSAISFEADADGPDATVIISATDERGQTTTVEKSVSVTTPPKHERTSWETRVSDAIIDSSARLTSGDNAVDAIDIEDVQRPE